MEAVPRMPMIWLDLKEAGEFQFSPTVKQVRDQSGLIETHTTVTAPIHTENKLNSMICIGDLPQNSSFSPGPCFFVLAILV